MSTESEPSVRGGRARRGGTLAAVALSLLALAGGAELLLRALDAAPRDADPRPPAARADLPHGLLAPHDDGGWRAVPGVWLPDHVVGPRGYRVPAGAPADAASLRVAVVGDAFTFGWDLPYAETSCGLLAWLCARGGVAADVANLALPATDAALASERVARDALPARPELVVLQVGHADLAPRAPGAAPDGALDALALVRFARALARRGSNEPEPEPEAAAADVPAVDLDERAAAWGAVFDDVRAAGAESALIGPTRVRALVPDPLRLAWADAVRRLAGERGVPWIDGPSLQRRYRPLEWLRRAHEIAAFLEGALRRAGRPGGATAAERARGALETLALRTAGADRGEYRDEHRLGRAEHAAAAYALYALVRERLRPDLPPRALLLALDPGDHTDPTLARHLAGAGWEPPPLTPHALPERALAGAAELRARLGAAPARLWLRARRRAPADPRDAAVLSVALAGETLASVALDDAWRWVEIPLPPDAQPGSYALALDAHDPATGAPATVSVATILIEGLIEGR